jgi:hypothetical protein
MDNKSVVILGGGTLSHIRNHLALCAPAYGDTARWLYDLCNEHSKKLNVSLQLTRMAGGDKNLETIEDVSRLVDRIIIDSSVKIVFFNVAMVDFEAAVMGDYLDQVHRGKSESRLTSDKAYGLSLHPSVKIINNIRKDRKDIFLVGFKTTINETSQEQYLKGLNLLKKASCNLVLANDLVTRNNMIITPEEAVYHETIDRGESLKNLVEMAYLRSHLTFTRSSVIGGVSVPWNSKEVPSTLRKIVDHCIEFKAYKVFNGATVGHFAVKLNDTMFLTSKRKTNFNDLYTLGLVKVETDGPDSVVAYGAKPSVGGQSQRIVFAEHQDCDCIVHFHCPLKDKPKDEIKVMSQREFECGSHQCGQNTSNGLKKFGNLYCVMLDRHGPNIVFNKDIDPQEVIDFIDANFDLAGKTGGYVI